jgi:hypothetical protein
MSQPPRPASGFLQPLPLVALAVLALNDHVLKGSAPGWLTGKLSDVAGMVFFPLLLQAMWELLRARLGGAWGPSRRVLVACAAATAVVFGAMQVWPLAGDAYRWGLGALQWPAQALRLLASGRPVQGVHPVHLTPDPSDLLTVPFVLVAVATGWRRAALSGGATPPAGHPTPEYPGPD